MKTNENLKLKVFLCHASEDKEKVRHLYKMIKDDGFDPWLDEEDIIPGQDWKDAIIQALQQTHAVIVCLSNDSITKAGHVQKEISDALDIADQQPENTIFIIPLKFEQCNVPRRLKKWHWVDYFDEKGHERLLKALTTRCSDLNLNYQRNKLKIKPEINSALGRFRKSYQNQKLLNWDDFEWVSNLRQELSLLLDDKEKAFALKNALQHGKNLPFWCNLNSNNQFAVISILSPIYENYGRRPLLRAGYAFENLDGEFKKQTYEKIKDYLTRLKDMGNDVPARVIDAANSGGTLELWRDELQNDPTYGTVIKQLIREISEPVF